MSDTTLKMDSGSPERVALDLMYSIMRAPSEALRKELEADRGEAMLDLYATCLVATRGGRRKKATE